GASPGASTSVKIMLDVLQKCFPVQWASATIQTKLRTISSWWGMALHQDPKTCNRVRAASSLILQLG
ncbi:MAG TPA: malate:quinone oxidoreductase, partial [Rhodothermales bacterium]|nr:malate:quinone oxidoreductase [Rhodothermales bacterium]